MIKLFVTDLDGCISYPFRTPNWDAINAIRELNRESRNDPAIPPLTICTGRPYPYAEAVAQFLDIQLPFVFESAALFLWEGNKVETAFENTESDLEPILEMKQWIKDEILPSFPTAQLEFTKMMDAGIVCPHRETVDEIRSVVDKKIASDYPNLEVHSTDVSVNILMPGNNKYRGMSMLAKEIGITLKEIAYIGDTSGDIQALQNVRMAFSPLNAIDEVKKVTETIELEATEAVLDAYRRIIELNRNHSGV